MAKKFIINNGNLVMGHVEYHKELLSDHTKTVGGGWWEYNKEKDIMYLYSRSMDFGQAKREDVIGAIQTGLISTSLNNTKFFHSYEEFLCDVMEDENGVWIEVPEENKL
jgi:hypothetical protein